MTNCGVSASLCIAIIVGLLVLEQIESKKCKVDQDCRSGYACRARTAGSRSSASQSSSSSSGKAKKHCVKVSENVCDPSVACLTDLNAGLKDYCTLCLQDCFTNPIDGMFIVDLIIQITNPDVCQVTPFTGDGCIEFCLSINCSFVEVIYATNECRVYHSGCILKATKGEPLDINVIAFC